MWLPATTRAPLWGRGGNTGIPACAGNVEAALRRHIRGDKPPSKLPSLNKEGKALRAGVVFRKTNRSFLAPVDTASR